MKHEHVKRVGNNVVGTQYVFTLLLINGTTETVTLQPHGHAFHYWQKGWFGKIKEIGSEGMYSLYDSMPDLVINKIKDNQFILCDSGNGINGSQVFMNKIKCVASPCEVPMVIERKQISYADY